jgi:hypothetical protein
MVTTLAPAPKQETVNYRQFSGPNWIEEAFADQRARIDRDFGPGTWQQLADDTDTVISAVIARRWNPSPPRSR